MDFSLSPEQRELREAIVRFAKAELNDGVIARDREQKFSRDLWKQCAQVGLMGLPVPEEYGGGGFDALTCAIALEALGYGCSDNGLSFSICAHLLACVVPIWKFGSEEQKRRLLPGLCDGSLIGGHAMTEPQSGSDAFNIRTIAEPNGTGYSITGTKTFTSNAPECDVLVVFALTDPEKGYFGGVTGFVLERGMKGLHTGPKMEKMGLRTSPIGDVVLEDVHVTREAVLGKVGGGAGIFGHAMEWERTLLFATHIGIAQRLMEQAISYARTRTQFGQRIGKFQAVSHRIADMKVNLEAARLLVYQSAWKLSHSRSVALDSAIAKLFTSEMLVKTAMDTVQVFGGYGFATEYEVERALRDAIGGRLYSGTSEMQRSIIARWLGL
jgi:alkylation response protein AidB-like acyl-CoA dehydrogenase